MRTVEKLTDKIIHVLHYPGETAGINDFMENEVLNISYKDTIVISESAASFKKKDVYKYVIDGEPVIKKKKTANGEVSYIENAKEIVERQSYSACLRFKIGEKEQILGLGQYEDGIINYRDHREYLYESNMRIAIPFFVTTGGYGVYIDSESNMIFTSAGNEISFNIATTDKISYYIFLGDGIDEIIAGYQQITGRASMLPKWVFGYIQSKERYESQDETLQIMRQFRDRKIPIDCIVQDWYSWEEGLWGEKIFDKKRFPDLKSMVDTLHGSNIHYMVSVWPNMNPDSSNYAEFKEAGKLLPNSNLYDAFDKEARDLYFDQCRREIMDSGSDGLWCDNAEPFSDADWNGEKKRPEEDRYNLVVGDSLRSIPWEQINAYGLYHAKGIYENWRKHYPGKRVVNLTRSGYASCQKYGTILWSGDITAKWSTLKKQIAEGMKMGLSGMPYWTLDIGGFFVVKDKYENRGCNSTSTDPLWFWDGDYNEGIGDMGYCELYTRWLQFGTFLPIFRSHGTDTPREPWQFDEFFYNPIVKFIKLRYELMPYIYSLAYMAHKESYIIMRSLAFDYSYDKCALACDDQYMFGPSILVCPVTEAMYYAAGSIPIEGNKRNRNVYLPEGTKWYDFWDNRIFEGGNYINYEAPIDIIPVFVKGGSIISMSEPMNYAGEKDGAIKELRVYAGSDCEMVIYNDKGDDYDFENNGYCEINAKYNEEGRTLILEKAKGDYPVPQIEKVCFINIEGKRIYKDIKYTGEELKISLK